METKLREGKLALWGVLAAIILIFSIVLLVRFNLEKIIMPSTSTAIERVVVIEAEVAKDPEVYSFEDSDTCESFLTCLKENNAQWRFFSRSTFVQDHGTLYSMYIYCSNGEQVECIVFDQKLYCGKFAYALSDEAKNNIVNCIEDAVTAYNK